MQWYERALHFSVASITSQVTAVLWTWRKASDNVVVFWFVRFDRPKHVCFGSSQGGCVAFFGIILTPTLVLFRWGPRSLGAAWAIMQVKPGLLHWIYWLICSPDRLPGWVCTFETALVLGWWIKRWWLFEIMSMSLIQFRKCFDQNWLYFTAVFISGLLLFSDLHLGILSIVKVSDLIR